MGSSALHLGKLRHREGNAGFKEDMCLEMHVRGLLSVFPSTEAKAPVC